MEPRVYTARNLSRRATAMAKSGNVVIRGAMGAALMMAAIGCGSAQQRPALEQQAVTEEVAPEPSVGPSWWSRCSRCPGSAR